MDAKINPVATVAPVSPPARKVPSVRMIATIGMILGFAGGLVMSMHTEQSRLAKLNNAHMAKAEPVLKTIESGSSFEYSPMVAED